MSRTIRVHIGETPRPVGLVRHDIRGARENASFEYDPLWLAAADRFAFDPALPLVPGAQFHRRTDGGSIFHNAIADTEVDGWGR